jgi:cation diffusion facilitator CzcD-associated flavoprotein CzcO
MTSIETTVLVVGAGPYGISLGQELWRRGVPALVVGDPFSLWLDHTLSGANLRSDVNASDVYAADGRFSLRRWLHRALGHAEALDVARRRVPVEVFRGYARWILRSLPFEPLRDEVTSLAARPGGGFEAALRGGGVVRARVAVLASGIGSHRHLPEPLRGLPRDRVLHSWDVRRVEGSRDRRILVVGGGQSGAEIAGHLVLGNEVTWVHRGRLTFYAEPINLPRLAFRTVLRASALFGVLPARLRRRAGRTFVASTITPDLRPRVLHRSVRRRQADAVDLGLEPVGATIRSRALGAEYDLVVAATGYRYALETVGYLDPALLARIARLPGGAPRLSRAFETSVPGLHAVGGLAEPSHGPAQRFMFGCRQATLRVSRAVGRR